MKKKGCLITLFFLLCLSLQAQQEIRIARYFGNRQAAISYTFDDGLLEHYTEVFPRLKSHQIRASFCVIGSTVGGYHKGTPCMTWSQLKEMAADGQEITSHGWQHKNVTKLTPWELRYEVQHNDTVIWQYTGSFPRTYFYPGNRKSEEVIAFCSEDRVGTRVRQVDVGSRRSSAWLKHWVDSLLASQEWGVTMTHGIRHGYDAFKDPQILWEHLDYVCTKRDSIWVGTFHDVCAYIRERDAVSLEVNEGEGNTIIVPSLALDSALFHHPLTLIIPDNITYATQGEHHLTIYKNLGLQCIDINPWAGQIELSTEPATVLR